jgi:hypothetical protein
MTYPPGSPGYPPAQSGSYAGVTPSFTRGDDALSKLPLSLKAAVVVLGLAVYLLNFGPTFTVGADLGPGLGGRAGDAGTAVILAVLAALLAGLSLLPKARSSVGIVGVVAALGALVAIAETINVPVGFTLGWAMWPLVACCVLQAIAAGLVVLLDAGVIAPPTPRPRYDPYAQYGQYGPYGQYGQQPYYGQQSAQQQPAGYGARYGGYGSSRGTAHTAAHTAAPTAGFGAQPQPGHQSATHHTGTSTPPTGFPSFTPPPSAAPVSGSETSSAPVDYTTQSDDHQGPQSPSGSASV